MRFTHIDVSFDIKYEGHQNCSKALSMHILRVFGHHHMWHQNWLHCSWIILQIETENNLLIIFLFDFSFYVLGQRSLNRQVKSIESLIRRNSGTCSCNPCDTLNEDADLQLRNNPTGVIKAYEQMGMPWERIFNQIKDWVNQKVLKFQVVCGGGSVPLLFSKHVECYGGPVRVMMSKVHTVLWSW